MCHRPLTTIKTEITHLSHRTRAVHNSHGAARGKSVATMADARGAGYSRMGSMDQEHEIQGSNHGFIVYRRRWVVLLAFCLVSIANQTIYGTFTTISTFVRSIPFPWFWWLSCNLFC